MNDNEEFSDETDEESEDTSSEISSSNGEDSRIELLQKELGDVPFEDLEKAETQLQTARQDKDNSSKRNNEKYVKTEKDTEKSELFAENRKKKDSRPLEMSSKQKPPKVRKVLCSGKKITRDPRFDDLSGKLNQELFKKSYAFLDDIKDKEKKELKKKMKKVKNAEKKKDIQGILKKMEQDEKMEKVSQESKQREREWKKKEMEAIKQGKKPYFLKKSEKKKLELTEKFEKLKETGQLEKYLSKKRKRNAAKDRKHLPKKRLDRT